MSLEIGQEIALLLEKPAAGGRAIARHDGQVVLVAGGIPGERVRARIERVETRLAFASATAIVEPSPDRRDGAADPACGGVVYSHIRYQRQLALKSELIADAFTRLGRLPIDHPIPVASSPERGYRMRARFHVRGTRAGFYREGSHEVCDAGPSALLTSDSLAAVDAAVASLLRDDAAPVTLQLTENIPGAARAVHVDVAFGARLSEPALARAAAAAGLTGCTARTPAGVLMTAGTPAVADSLAGLTGGRATAGQLRRHPESFFQANRFLLPSLVSHVLDAIPEAGRVLDLYAGVGLFAVALAALGRTGITAVEGDPASARDLRDNASPFGAAVRVSVGGVEAHLARSRDVAETIVVDPPRTGISRRAMEAIARRGAARVVYVSCDPPTMARDARRLADAGYRLASLRGFDLFPNTPHVETVGVFDRVPRD
jgi:23S rRNA (uracil1939-C5)-methyltransferase